MPYYVGDLSRDPNLENYPYVVGRRGYVFGRRGLVSIKIWDKDLVVEVLLVRGEEGGSEQPIGFTCNRQDLMCMYVCIYIYIYI